MAVGMRLTRLGPLVLSLTVAACAAEAETDDSSVSEAAVGEADEASIDAASLELPVGPAFGRLAEASARLLGDALDRVPGETLDAKAAGLARAYDGVEGDDVAAKAKTIAKVIAILRAAFPASGEGAQVGPWLDLFGRHYPTFSALAGDDGHLGPGDVEPIVSSLVPQVDGWVASSLRQTGCTPSLGGERRCFRPIVANAIARRIDGGRARAYYGARNQAVGEARVKARDVFAWLGAKDPGVRDAPRAVDLGALLAVASDARSAAGPSAGAGIDRSRPLPVVFPDGIPIRALAPLGERKVPVDLRIGVATIGGREVVILRGR